MKNVYSIILASILFLSFNAQAEENTAAGSVSEYPEILVLAKEACNKTTASLIVGMRNCNQEPVLKFMTDSKIFDENLVKWTGFENKNNLSESSAVETTKTIITYSQYIAIVVSAFFFFVSIIILAIRAGKLEFKGIWNEASAKQVLNTLYNLIFVFSYNKLSAIQAAFWLAMSTAIFSLFAWLTYNKPQSEYEAQEQEALDAGKTFAMALINTAREMEETRNAQLNLAFDYHVSNSNDSVSEIIKDFNENFKYSTKAQKIEKSNWDATLSISNMYNTYDFVNKIQVVKKPTKEPVIYGYSPIEPVASAHSDNSIFKKLESSLSESVNDGTILSALSEANKTVASSVDVKKILPLFEAEIKKAKLDNSYSDKMNFSQVNDIIKTFAIKTAKPYIETVNSETTKQADFKFLVAQGMKILTNSALGYNSQTTVADWQAYANEIPALEKTLACSKDFKKYQSERDIIAKLDYNASALKNISNSAYVFTSCVRLDGNRLVALGFDAEAQPEKYLDLMATVEAKKLALQRAAASIRISFFNASEQLINESNTNNEKNNTEKEKVQLNESLKKGIIGITAHYAKLASSSVSKNATRDAFLQTSDYVYHGREDGYINLQVLFNKPSLSELSETQKSFLEKFDSIYDDSISINTSLRDYSSIDALESSAQTEEKDIWLFIEKTFLDLRPLKNLIGVNADADLATGIKQCTTGGDCSNRRVPITQAASELGRATNSSIMTIIIAHKGVQIVKSFVDSVVGADAVGSASNNKKSGFMGKVTGKLAVLPIFLLNILEATLSIAAGICWWILPLSYFAEVIPPLLPFILALILILDYIAYLLLFNVVAPIRTSLEFSDNRFSIKDNIIQMAVNHARIFVGSIMIIVFMICDLYLPVDTLILGLADAIYDGSLLSLLNFIVIALLLLAFVIGFMTSLVINGHASIMEKLGGERSVLETGVATKAVVLGKITELTFTVKNKVNQIVDEKIAEKEKQKKLEEMKTVRDKALKINHNAE